MKRDEGRERERKREISYLPNPPIGQDMTEGHFLSGVFTGLNSEFYFS